MHFRPSSTVAGRWSSILAAAVALWLCVSASPEASAQTPNSSQPIPNAIALVKGTESGKEVDRWAGEVIWLGPTPIEFTAERKRGRWVWGPHTPEELQILVSERKPHGKSVEEWAEVVKARSLLVIIAPRPGNAIRNTATAYRSTRSTRPSRLAEAVHDARGADEIDRRLDDTRPRETPADGHPGGQGERGIGAGRGQGGDRAQDGLGDRRGRARGHANGAVRPSRVQNKRAALTTERGGHTPADGGKRRGSAGGSEGGTGNIHGSGWLGLIDAPENVAPLVSAGLILIDANILGFGHKMLSRVVRGITTRALRKKLGRDAARIVAHDLAKVRDKLARSPQYRSLSPSEQLAKFKRTEAAMTRAYFARAKKLFTDKAVTYDQLAAKYASHSGKVQKRIRTLATENATAYRKMARAADDAHAARGGRKTVTVSSSRHPESAAHIEDAQAAGHPSTLTVDRAGAKFRRRQALKGKKSQAGTDRDEYPPAMFEEGGAGSSVRNINPSDNRGAGACVGAQCRDLPDGTQVDIKVE